MNQQTNGEIGFTIEQKWHEASVVLHEYLNSLKLKVSNNSNIDQLLNLSSIELNAMNAIECGNNAYLLSQYTLFLQKEINRHQTKRNWAETNLGIMLGKYGRQYGNDYTKLEERRLMLIADNNYASKLNEIIRTSNLFIDQLSFITRRVEHLADTLRELQQTKRLYERKT